MLRPLCLVSFLLLSTFAFSQDLPKTIRGYPVHRQSVAVAINAADDRSDVKVKIGEPVLTDVALAGVSFELPAEITSARQSGEVDFLTFHDMKVNGVAVEVEEYKHPFEFRKTEAVTLKPAKIFLPTSQLLRATWREMRESKKEWTVKGRVFVFGRFRKLGFKHRRVVPVDVEFKIKNPLAGEGSKPS